MIFSCDYTPARKPPPGRPHRGQQLHGEPAGRAAFSDVPRPGVGAVPNVTVTDPAGHSVTASGAY